MRKKSIILAALLIFAVIGVGIVAAETYHDRTHAVDDNTTEVYLDVEDTNGTDVDVTVYGVESDGNESQVDTAVLNAASGETDTYNYTNIEPSTYDEYRITVTNTTSGQDAPASISSGIKEDTSDGGGGFDLSQNYFGVPLYILIFLGIGVGGFLMNKES
jgi:hypothetical protein